jgi:hypothetical protein
MKALLFVALLAVAAPALAQTPVFVPEYQEPSPSDAKYGDYRNIHSVALVVLLNDQLAIGRRHYIVSLQMGSRDIAEWGIRAETGRALHRYLSNRFTIKDFSPAVIARPDNPQFRKDLRVSFLERYYVYRKYLTDLADGSFDAFIVLHESNIDDSAFYYAAPQNKFYIDYTIDILDGRTFTMLGSSTARIQEPDWDTPRIAVRELPCSVDFDFDFNTSPREWDLLRREATVLMRRSLVEILRSLRLGLDLPPPNDPSLYRLDGAAGK